MVIIVYVDVLHLVSLEQELHVFVEVDRGFDWCNRLPGISSFKVGLLAASIGSDTRSSHSMGAFLKGLNAKGMRGWFEPSSAHAPGDHFDCWGLNSGFYITL